MGIIGSLDFVASDFRIKYVDSMIPSNMVGYPGSSKTTKGKKIRVKIAKDIIEDIVLPDSDLTVGWLLSEVTRRYDTHFDKTVGNNDEHLYSKKLIVGFKTVGLIPALDYYLTHLDNSLAPIKDKTVLAVHYSKMKEDDHLHGDYKRRIGKEDFQYLKVIG